MVTGTGQKVGGQSGVGQRFQIPIIQEEQVQIFLYRW